MSEHVSRWWSRRVVAVLAILGLAGTMAVPRAAAQEPPTAVVTMEAMGTDGIAGLALLMPVSGGTSVQIVVAGAPAGTLAVVHRGTCEAIDPAPVALLGDVSTTSQITVANGFGTLTDGAHVLALHAGLDLASAIACGPIPAGAGAEPSPAPSEEPPAPSERPSSEGGSFTGPLTGFGITWPAGWTRYEVAAFEGEDRIGLSDAATSIFLAAAVAPDGDPQACVRAARQRLFDRLDAGSVRDIAPVTDTDGTIVSGAETDRAWLAYRYVSVGSDGERDLADHLECRRYADVILYLLHRSPADGYWDATAAREDLLTGLTFGGTRSAPVASAGPSPAVSPSVAPPPPSATPNADCEGFAPWHAATLARIDVLTQLKAEADDAAMAYDEPRYVAVFVRAARDLQRMRGEQERDPVPPAARDANRLAVTTFESYASAARLFAEYYQTSTTTATLQRAARAQRAAEQLEAELNVALADVEATCG